MWRCEPQQSRVSFVMPCRHECTQLAQSCRVPDQHQAGEQGDQEDTDGEALPRRPGRIREGTVRSQPLVFFFSEVATAVTVSCLRSDLTLCILEHASTSPYLHLHVACRQLALRLFPFELIHHMMSKWAAYGRTRMFTTSLPT